MILDPRGGIFEDETAKAGIFKRLIPYTVFMKLICLQ
jgi:hypothetical protein